MFMGFLPLVRFSKSVWSCDPAAIFNWYTKRSIASSVDTALLSTGRLKVFRSNRNWLEEFRVYARDQNGKIINKLKFRRMAATRYLILDKVGSWITQPCTRRARTE